MFGWAFNGVWWNVSTVYPMAYATQNGAVCETLTTALVRVDIQAEIWERCISERPAAVLRNSIQQERPASLCAPLKQGVSLNLYKTR